MLDHVSRGIPPVVENLTTQYMSPHTPDTLVSLIRKPLVAQLLRVKIVDFERAMMYMRLCCCAQEYCVMIYEVFASVDMRKDSHDFFGAIVARNIQKVGWDNVEVLSVPF